MAEQHVLSRVRDVMRLRVRGARRVFISVVVLGPLTLSIVGIYANAQDNVKLGTSVGLAFVLLLLGLVLDELMQHRLSDDFLVFDDELDAGEQQRQFIKEHRPSSVQFLEYSGVSVADTNLIGVLAEARGVASIKVLVCHPEQAIDGQLTRLADGLQGLFRACDQDVDEALQRAKKIGLHVRCYHERASLRGRAYGDSLIVLGWYTYDKRLTQYIEFDQIWGHENPLVWARGSTSLPLRTMYKAIFGRLWDSATPVSRAWPEDMRTTCPSLPPRQWLACVSGPPTPAAQGR